MTDWPLEILKLGAQLAGALGVSWLTVRWALGRYKSEKLWERETGALVDLLTAIGEMQAVTYEWIADDELRRERTEEWSNQQSAQYQNAKRRIEGNAAVAAVVLPAEIEKVLDDLLEALSRRFETWSDDLYETRAALGAAQKQLVAFGRKRLGYRGTK